MKFDQIAVVCADLADHFKVVHQMREWGQRFDAEDTVTAVGRDHAGRPIHNRARLSFAYEVWPGHLEHEVLTYLEGFNWHELNPAVGGWPFLSHFGVHLSNEAEIAELRRHHQTLQEVVTIAHENHALAERRYRYIILATRPTLGAELKIIQRLTLEEAARWRERLG